MAWLSDVVIAAILTFIYVLLPILAEPSQKGHGRSIGLPQVLLGGILAFLTVRGLRTGNVLLMVIPPLLVTAITLGQGWIFRKRWCFWLKERRAKDKDNNCETH